MRARPRIVALQRYAGPPITASVLGSIPSRQQNELRVNVSSTKAELERSHASSVTSSRQQEMPAQSCPKRREGRIQCVYGSTEGNVPSAAPTSSPEITSFDLNKNPAGQLWADLCRSIRKSATRSNRAVPPQQSTSLLVTSSVRFSTPSAGHRKRGGRNCLSFSSRRPTCTLCDCR